MKRASAVLLVLFLVGLGTVVEADKKDKSGTSARVLTGKVTDKQDNPLPNAVVYLTDTRSRGVKTYIVGPDGAYRFPALSPNIDYEVYAQYNGRKSDTKTVSQFDNRSQVNINLKIDTR
jgi:Carboxypeptidase regulatory-like domain